jgi:hypothetical protein
VNSPLEYSGRPAAFNPKFGLAVDDAGEPILAHDATLVLCAWHDADKSLTKQLKAAGYQVSHGICADHLASEMATLKDDE